MAALISDRLRFAIDIMTLLLNYVVKRLSEVRTAPYGVVVAHVTGRITSLAGLDRGRNAHAWSLTVSRSMRQIQLPKRGRSKARAPRGAMTKMDSNVHIVVAISYSSPQSCLVG